MLVAVSAFWGHLFRKSGLTKNSKLTDTAQKSSQLKPNRLKTKLLCVKKILIYFALTDGLTLRS
jgi:hypothetical protein